MSASDMWIAMSEPGARTAPPATLKTIRLPCVREKNVAVERIVEAVAPHFGIAPFVVLAPWGFEHASEPPIVRVRSISMHVARERYGYSMPALGRYFGRDHKTVHSSLRRVAAELDADPELRANVARLVETFQRAATGATSGPNSSSASNEGSAHR